MISDEERRTGTPAVVVRDPVWNTIRVDRIAMRILESAAFQRLRYIRQLGHAHLVYPGATHTRFDHALGVYHLTRRALALLAERSDTASGALEALPADERDLVALAALLHDVGHYPYSHALEELEASRIPGHHEALTGRFLDDPDVRGALEEVSPDGPAAIEALIRGRSSSPLQGLVSGSLDLDKIEYLKRDAFFCGVPYGEVDVDRLLHNLIVVEDPESGRPEVGVHEKGVAALESLLFAKYQMFRNVYWHHAVRAATVLYIRIVADALDAGLIGSDELVGQTDDRLLSQLEERAREGDRDGARDGAAGRVGRWVGWLRGRRLPKRAAEVRAAELDGGRAADWVIGDSPFKRRVETRLAEELEVEPYGAFLDYPEKSAMFALDLLVRRRSGGVVRVGPTGRAGLIRLPRVADELYQTARVLRLFTLGGRRSVGAGPLAALVAAPASEVEERLENGRPLLA